MSRRSDGAYRCDRCNLRLVNAAVTECAIVSTLDDSQSEVRVYHFCREPNDGAPEGCAAHLLVPSNLAAYTASLEPADG